jgi:hypothetical protein
LAPVFSVKAIPTFYGSSYDTPGKWIRLLNTNASIYVSSADFFHHPWQAGDLPQIADSGLKVNFRIFWWQGFHNGEITRNTSVVDLYYNASLLRLLEEHIDRQFSYLDPEKIWAVTLSEGEPGYSFRYFNTPEGRRKYNDTYHSETGFWLKAGDLPGGESLVFNNWMSEKWSWVFNHLYGYVKIRWPHILVFQSAEQWPGAPPVWIGGIDVSDVKADAFMGDLYYNEAYDNPFWFYEFVRQHKTSIPDKDYHIWLWGEEAWPEEGLAGGFEHIRRNAWVAYLAGADAIGWFNWHNIHGNILDREDSLGKRLYEYTNRLNQELAKLPPFKPRPQILVIRDQTMSFQAGLCCDLGLFNEWDVVNQVTLVKKETDLSQYKLIMLSEDVYHDEIVHRLNDYVKSGGNLVLLGGFASAQNAYGNATRTKLLIEEGDVGQEFMLGDINVNISEPNPLGLNLQYGQSNAMIGITKTTMTDDHHPIGEFNYVDEDGGLSITTECPLVLYHNSSNPDEGSILYWGILGPISTHDGKHKEAVKAFLPEWNYTRHLYRTVTRAFASNYLHLEGSLATSGTENMIITQSEIEDGVIIAGISNYHPQNVNVNFNLDLDQFGLPAGNYWVHSLDENSTLGWFESQMNLLEVPIEVTAQGTRLLLVSQKQIVPSYSVNIFPDVPTPEEAEELWLPRLKIISDYGSVKGEGKYDQGSTASFDVSPTNIQDDLGIRHVFKGWNSSDPGGYTGPNNPAKVVMENDIAEIASWKTQYFLTLEAGTGGSVTPFSDWYDAGSEVTIQAVPRSGFLFSSWIGSGSGSYSGSNSTITVRFDEPITEKAIFLDVAGPVAKAGSDRAVQVGENVVFDSRGSTDNVGIVSYEWDLGDGVKEVGPIAIHVYNEIGSRTVTLIVKDAVGNSDTDTITITVEAKEPVGEKWKFPTWILILLGAGILIGVIPYLLTKVTSP